MNVHPKTVRRLSVLLVGFALIVAVLYGLFLMNEHRRAARLAAAREAGMAAFAAGDYPTTLDQLKQYVGRNKTDADALFAYGTARSRIEEPNGKHILEGIGVFR